MIRQQLILFFTALQFYTRIPTPENIPFDPENLSPATRFLPLIGWIVGGISAVVLAVMAFFDISAAIICSMLASILVTGALHEDGLADACDGFGGGLTKEKILLIMKDSRIGTYGVIGLIGILALKFSLLKSLSLFTGSPMMGLLMVSGHALSRFMPVLLISKYDYARYSVDSKSGSVARKPSWATLSIAAAFAIAPLMLLAIQYYTAFILLIIPFLVLITYLMGRYFKKWIGGYTGDCLGAVQQVNEVTFYFFLVALWSFI